MSNFKHRLIIKSKTGLSVKEINSKEDILNLPNVLDLKDTVQIIDKTTYGKTVEEFIKEYSNADVPTESPTDTDEAATDVNEETETVTDTPITETKVENVVDSTSTSSSQTLLVKLDPQKRKPEVVDAADSIDFSDDLNVYGVGITKFSKPLKWGIVKDFLTDDLFETPFLYTRGKASMTDTRKKKLAEIAGFDVTDNFTTEIVETSDGPYMIARATTMSTVNIEDEPLANEPTAASNAETVVENTTTVSQTQDTTEEVVVPYEQPIDEAIQSASVVKDTTVVFEPVDNTQSMDYFVDNTVIDTISHQDTYVVEPTHVDYTQPAASFIPVQNDFIGQPTASSIDPFSTYKDSNSFALDETIKTLQNIQAQMVTKDQELSTAKAHIVELNTRIESDQALIRQLTPMIPEHIGAKLVNILANTTNAADVRTVLILQITDAIKAVVSPDMPKNHISPEILDLATAIHQSTDVSALYLQVVRYLTII